MIWHWQTRILYPHYINFHESKNSDCFFFIHYTGISVVNLSLYCSWPSRSGPLNKWLQLMMMERWLKQRAHYRHCILSDGAQTVGRKTSWEKDVWANYFLGDRRLGDKLGWYGDSKLDSWATFFRRLGEMYEKRETSDTIIRQMCAVWLKMKTECTTLRNTINQSVQV